jgi:hypothetical protein
MCLSGLPGVHARIGSAFQIQVLPAARSALVYQKPTFAGGQRISSSDASFKKKALNRHEERSILSTLLR